jgi:hypothetical protein
VNIKGKVLRGEPSGRGEEEKEKIMKCECTRSILYVCIKIA